MTVQTEGIKVLRDPEWLAMDWLLHGFSTRTGGYSTAYATHGCGELNLGFTPADDRDLVLRNRDLLLQNIVGDEFAPLASAESPCPVRLTTVCQVHSADIQVVRPPQLGAGELLTGDGLMSHTAGAILAIQTADCVPVLLIDVKQRAVAALHAGWRGTVQRIVEGGVYRMDIEFGCKPTNMRALIGPAIGSCCYAVGDEVYDQFRRQFDYAEELFSAPHEGVRKLNLVLANQRQLLEGGLASETIRVVGGCTSCQPDIYFSHRQSRGHTGRMMSVVGIRGGSIRLK